MSVVTQEVPRLRLAPNSSGVSLTPEEFDAAEFEEGWRYELIHGVLVVSPPPLRKERDPKKWDTGCESTRNLIPRAVRWT